MEMAIATASLIWVIGTLVLQKMDAVIDEFVKASAYYLSMNQDGSVDQVQLSVKSLLPKTSIISITKSISTSKERWDRGGLKKSLQFYQISNRIKFTFELILIVTTTALPFIYLVDFNKFVYATFVNKDVFVYGILCLTVMAGLILQKILRGYSDKLYPLKIKIDVSNRS